MKLTGAAKRSHLRKLIRDHRYLAAERFVMIAERAMRLQRELCMERDAWTGALLVQNSRKVYLHALASDTYTARAA